MATVEPNSEIYKVARDIAGKALGKDISPAVGAIDPSIFALIDLIAEWIIKILTKLRELRQSDEEIVETLRRPTWLWKRRITMQVRSEVPAKFRADSPKIAAELFTCAERVEAEKVKAGLAELGEDDFLLI